VKVSPELADALIGCVREPGVPTAALDAAIAADRTGQLVDAARAHRVLAQVTASLQASLGVPPELLEELARAAVERTVRQLELLDDLRLFGETMTQIDVPWLVFKGPVIAHTLYERPELRTFQDVDVLLPQEGFARTLTELERRGFVLLDRNWRLIGRERRGQLHLQLRLGSVADVHWHLLNRASVRDAFRISMSSVVASSRRIALDGLSIVTLGEVDTLVHLCVHAALGGADRLLWLSDVARSIARTPPSWELVVERAHAWRAGPSTALVLRRAREVLGADAPEEVEHALDPSPLHRAVGRWVERRWPIEQWAGQQTAAGVWSEGLREGVGRTAQALGARAVRPAANAVRRFRGEPTAHRDGGTGAILEAAGGQEAREAYLRSVDPTFEATG
jgi:hypothetical protein